MACRFARSNHHVHSSLCPGQKNRQKLRGPQHQSLHRGHNVLFRSDRRFCLTDLRTYSRTLRGLRSDGALLCFFHFRCVAPHHRHSRQSGLNNSQSPEASIATNVGAMGPCVGTRDRLTWRRAQRASTPPQYLLSHAILTRSLSELWGGAAVIAVCRIWDIRTPYLSLSRRANTCAGGTASSWWATLSGRNMSVCSSTNQRDPAWIRFPRDQAIGHPAAPRTVILAGALLRLQCLDREEACGKTPLHAPQPGRPWPGRETVGLAMVQFPPLRNRFQRQRRKSNPFGQVGSLTMGGWPQSCDLSQPR